MLLKLALPMSTWKVKLFKLNLQNVSIANCSNRKGLKPTVSFIENNNFELLYWRKKLLKFPIVHIPLHMKQRIMMGCWVFSCLSVRICNFL